MKRIALIIGILAIGLAIQLLFSCADPLQQNDQNPVPPGGPHIDTIYIFDSVFITDTTPPRTDTIFIVDSVIIVDTVVHIDTVVVTDSSVSNPTVYCARIGACQHKIVWLLQNAPGTYRLDFAAQIARNQPMQTVEVDIDGQVFSWSPAREAEMTQQLDLGRNAVVQLTSSQPKAFGHGVDICLTVTKL